MPESLVSSVGRGYSDLCAALCSVSIDAEELQIWKEVDGVFTADPNKVSSARLLATITSEEAIELSYYGSEVSLGCAQGSMVSFNYLSTLTHHLRSSTL